MENYWNDFNKYPFYLSQTAYKYLVEILKDHKINTTEKLASKKILDVGAGEGNFILSLLRLGADMEKITAVEMIKERFDRLKRKIPEATLQNKNYLDLKMDMKFDIITILAVFSSILDENIQKNILKKAYNELDENGILIIYDYNENISKIKSSYYRSVSFKDLIEELKINKTCYRKYSRVYINAKVAKLLCKLNCSALIPFLQGLKIFNDRYSFIVIRKH